MPQEKRLINALYVTTYLLASESCMYISPVLTTNILHEVRPLLSQIHIPGKYMSPLFLSGCLRAVEQLTSVGLGLT